MLRLQPTTMFLLLLSSVTPPLDTYAETKVLTGEATYTMGDGESPSFAEAMVLQKAKQMALEQAGTYVESYTKVQNYQLTAEEIQTIAGGVLEVEVLDKSRNLVGDGLRFYVKIKATVTTDKMEELARRIKGKNVTEEYKKLQEEYARLTKEIETWKQLIVKMPTGPERETALDQIREREKAFGLVQKSEVALFQRLVSAQALIIGAKDRMAELDRLLWKIREQGHAVEIGKVVAHEMPGSSSDLILTIPVILRVSDSLISLLVDVAKSFDGNVSYLYPTRIYHLVPESIRNKIVSLSQKLINRNDDRFKILGDEVIGKYQPDIFQNLISANKGSLIKLSPDRFLQQSFQSRIENLSVVIQLHNSDESGWSCRVPTIVNRIFPAIWTKSQVPLEGLFSSDTMFFVSNYQGKKIFPDSQKYIVLLSDKVTFRVEVKLPAKIIEKLARVTGKLLEAGEADMAEIEICNIVLED